MDILLACRHVLLKEFLRQTLVDMLLPQLFHRSPYLNARQNLHVFKKALQCDRLIVVHQLSVVTGSLC